MKVFFSCVLGEVLAVWKTLLNGVFEMLAVLKRSIMMIP